MEFINNIFVNIAGLIRWVFDWLMGLLGLPLGLTDVLMVAVLGGHCDCLCAVRPFLRNLGAQAGRLHTAAARAKPFGTKRLATNHWRRHQAGDERGHCAG